MAATLKLTNGSYTVSTVPATLGANRTHTAPDATGTLLLDSTIVSPGFKNLIINGNFDIWQRATSVTANAAYSADRWMLALAGSTCTQDRRSFTIGQTTVPNNPKYYIRNAVTTSAGSTNYARMRYTVEDVGVTADKTVTLTFWAKADASKNMSVEFNQNFGTGGSPSTAVQELGVTKLALTTSWVQQTVTVTLPSISGKTIGSDGQETSYLIIRFWFDAGSSFNSNTNTLGQQSGTFDIAQVQLEVGGVASPFEVRPIGIEMALCQRYYEVLDLGTAATMYAVAGSSFATACRLVWLFKQQKRVAPTLGSLTYNNATSTSESISKYGVRFAGVATDTASISDTATADAEF